MDLLNSKIITTNADTLSQAQATGIYGFNTAENKLKATHVSDDNALKVAISQHLVDGPDMKARTDIADSATSTFLKCDADGKLEIEATLELDSSSLAKELTLGNVFGKVALTADRTFAIMNRQLGTSGQEVQHAKVMGSEDGATTGIQHQLAVDSAGHLQVDILSGGGSSDATAANQVISQGKLDSVISNTASLGDTANRTLLTAQNTTAISGDTANIATDVSSIDTKTIKCDTDNISGNVSVSSSVLPIGAATEGTLSALNTKVIACDTGAITGSVGITGLVNISASALPLPGGAAKEAQQDTNILRLDSIISNTANNNNTANRALLIAQNQTNGNQITNVKGNTAADGTGTATSVLVDTDGHLQVDILSGGGSSDATAANQVVSQGKLDSIVSNTASLGDTSNRTLLIAQNQTNGNQITKCMGLFGAAQVQLKVDTNGVLETSGGGGGGGGSTQYDSASTLPTPTVGTAVLGVDSGGLANVISTDDTGKVGSVMHGTNSSGVAYPVSINQFSRAIAVKNAITRSLQSSDTATIPAGTTYQSLYVNMFNVRNLCIFGNTTNLTDKIILYCKKSASTSQPSFKMPSEYDITPDSVSGDFFKQLEGTSIPYLMWGKDNSTGAAETIEVHFGYTD
jgi:hypothetical protein